MARTREAERPGRPNTNGVGRKGSWNDFKPCSVTAGVAVLHLGLQRRNSPNQEGPATPQAGLQVGSADQGSHTQIHRTTVGKIMKITKDNGERQWWA